MYVSNSDIHEMLRLRSSPVLTVLPNTTLLLEINAVINYHLVLKSSKKLSECFMLE